MGTWFRRLAWLLRQSRHDADLREEIEAHRALRASHLERDGLTPQEAAEASRRALGNTLLAREEASEIRLGSATPMTVPREFRGVALAAAAVLMAAFGSILLLACANVANLLLARGTARSQEIGVRLSLGASRARVVRQLLTESLLIAGAGGLLGSVLALWSFQTLAALALRALVPPGPRVSLVWDLSPDVRVLAFTVALTAATGVLFGLMPALYASRPDLLTVIKPDAPGATGRRRGRLRGTLVGVQVALCMTLMIAAGLLLRGLYATYTTDVRFVHRDVATVSLTQQGGYDPAELVVLQQRLMDRVQALPGVDAVAGATLAPLGTDEFFTVPLRLPEQSETEPLQTRMNGVTPGYFSLLGIPVVRGRAFTEADMANPDVAAGTRPAIVSETTARHLWPEGDPIGRIALWGDTTLRVVGVAADAQVTTLGAVDPYYVYVPVRQGPMLLVKSRAGFGATAAGIRNALQAIDPMLVPSVRPLEANLEWWRGVSSMLATLGTGLGVLALVLASVGIYGVVSYSVTRRHREIGVRMALGATAQHVLGMVLRQTMRPVVVGAVIGVAGASALSRVLSAVLFGVSPADPVGLGGAALLVLGVALAAGVMAAWPAARIDPAVTLRCE